MSTMSTQLNRLVKAFSLAESKRHPNIIPPQLLANAEGVMFFKKLPKGKMAMNWTSGVLFKRSTICKEKWSQPVSVHMSQGDLYYGNVPRVDRTDVIIIITDPELMSLFETFGQLGFSDDSNKLKKGICIENNEESMIHFAEMLSERPDIVASKDSFSFGLSDGYVFPVHIENPVVQVRESSNSKFYACRDASATRILGKSIPVWDMQKSDLISIAQRVLDRHFDVDARFPQYSTGGTTTSEGSPNPVNMSGSPNPLNDDDSSMDRLSHLMGRQWSDSCASAGGESTGWTPDDSSSTGGSTRQMRWESEDTTRSTYYEPVKEEVTTHERVRATSFDFS